MYAIRTPALSRRTLARSFEVAGGPATEACRTAGEPGSSSTRYVPAGGWMSPIQVTPRLSLAAKRMCAVEAFAGPVVSVSSPGPVIRTCGARPSPISRISRVWVPAGTRTSMAEAFELASADVCARGVSTVTQNQLGLQPSPDPPEDRRPRSGPGWRVESGKREVGGRTLRAGPLLEQPVAGLEGGAMRLKSLLLAAAIALGAGTSLYAQTLAARGAYVDALPLFEQALIDFRDFDRKAMVADTLNSMGWALLQLGDVDRARETLHEAIAIGESYGSSNIVQWTSLADLELAQRNLNEAEILYVRARDAAREIKYPFFESGCLAGLACVAALRGNAARAGELWGRVERIEDDTGERLHPWDRETYERILEPLRDDTAFRRGYDAGRATASAPIDPLPTPAR